LSNKTHLSIVLCIAGLSPKAVGRENKLDDMIYNKYRRR
jgi:hypothetical protein